MSDLMKLYCCLHARGQHEVRNRFVGVHLREQIGERVDRFRIADRDGADRARRSVHFPALGRRSEMRLQRARDRSRRRRDVDDDGAFQIEAGELVDVQLRDAQSVAGKHQRRVDRRSRIDPHAEVGVVAERQRLGSAIAHERHTRTRFDDAASLEPDR